MIEERALIEAAKADVLDRERRVEAIIQDEKEGFRRSKQEIDDAKKELELLEQQAQGDGDSRDTEMQQKKHLP